MPTIAEILAQSGMTTEQIAALDAKVVTSLQGYTDAQIEAAELKKREAYDFYNTTVNPALDKWGNEKTNMEAQLAYYKAQAEAAKANGFISNDPPGVNPPARNDAGRFVPGANPVPGSPALNVESIRQELQKDMAGAFSDATWAMQNYQATHNGQFLTEDVTQLAREANQQKLPFRDYVDRKFGFTQKRQEQELAARNKEKEDFAAAKIAENDRKWAEKTGHNPNVRQAESSQFSTISKAVSDKQRPDPLMLSPDERHRATGAAIRKDIAETVQ